MNDEITLDTVRPGHNAAPRGVRVSEGQPKLTIRLDPCLLGQLQHASRRMSLTPSSIARRGIELVLTGYPVLDPDGHDWLLKLAAANDLHGDPQAALNALLAHLARRYPAAGRLAPP